jgi:hypothetical protein
MEALAIGTVTVFLQFLLDKVDGDACLAHLRHSSDFDELGVFF